MELQPLEPKWVSEEAKSAYDALQECIRLALTPPESLRPEEHADWYRSTMRALEPTIKEAASIYAMFTGPRCLVVPTQPAREAGEK